MRLQAAGERDAAGLVGQRDGHVRADVHSQRLDRVTLHDREVVEAVEVDGGVAPARRLGPQHVERGDDLHLPVDAVEALQRAPIARVERAEVLGIVRPPRVLRCPGTQRDIPAPGIDPLGRQLVGQRQQRARETGHLGCVPKHAQLGAGSHQRRDALARQPGDHAAAGACPTDQLGGQPVPGLHAGPEDHAALGKLTPVDLHVGKRRHDEDRLARRRRRVGAQHMTRLLGVRRSGDEGQGHTTHRGKRGRQFAIVCVVTTDAETRQQMLDDLAAATDSVGLALGALGDAFELLDDTTAERLEELLFRPTQAAYARAQRTHAAFAARVGLSGQSFGQAGQGAPSHGARSFIDTAADQLRAADDGLAELQDSMLPVEYGDAELRADLSAVRRMLAPLPQAARQLTRTLGR